MATCWGGRSFLGLYLTHPVGHARGSSKSKSNLLYFPSFLFCSFRRGAAVLRAYTTDGEEGCSGVPTSGFHLSSELFMKGMTGIAEPDIGCCLLLFGSCSKFLSWTSFLLQVPGPANLSVAYCGPYFLLGHG